MARTRRRFTPEFKREAVRLVLEGDVHVACDFSGSWTPGFSQPWTPGSEADPDFLILRGESPAGPVEACGNPLRISKVLWADAASVHGTVSFHSALFRNDLTAACSVGFRRGSPRAGWLSFV